VKITENSPRFLLNKSSTNFSQANKRYIESVLKCLARYKTQKKHPNSKLTQPFHRTTSRHVSSQHIIQLFSRSVDKLEQTSFSFSTKGFKRFHQETGIVAPRTALYQCKVQNRNYAVFARRYVQQTWRKGRFASTVWNAVESPLYADNRTQYAQWHL